MREVLNDIKRWRSDGARMALARVIRVEGSGPRAPGATMVVRDDGRVAGSVSGGCVEGAVVSEATDALRTGRARLARFGYSDDDAFAVGLTCGGVITVFVSPSLLDVQEQFESALSNNEPVVLATVISVDGTEDALGDPQSGDLPYDPDCVTLDASTAPSLLLAKSLMLRLDGSVEGSFGDEEVDRVVTRDASGALASGRSMLHRYGLRGEQSGQSVTVFYEAFIPPPHMIIFGAVDFTGALVRIAKILGYRVTVCDARAPFATKERFPSADEVVVSWPDRYLATVADTLGVRDAVCVLTHDAKFDVPAIKSALATRVGYLGAMGSRRTQAERTERLIEAGVDPADLERLMAPIGLDLGARTPEETAVAICAEIIAKQTGRAASSLRDTDGPIHANQHALASSY